MKKMLLFLLGGTIAFALHAAINVPQQPAGQAGKLPLHDACDNDGSLEQLNKTIERLLQNNTLALHINEQDSEGNTALHLAAEHSSPAIALNMAQVLINNGASKTILNHSDNLPVDFNWHTDETGNPLNQLLAVSDEERQVLIMQARQNEIAQANSVDERAIKAGKVAVVEVSQPDLD